MLPSHVGRGVQLVEECLSLADVVRLEPFREGAQHATKRVSRITQLASPGKQATEAYRHSELEHAASLGAGHVHRARQTVFAGGRIGRQKDFPP